MTVDEIKKVLLVYGYEKVNDNEYKYDDDFLTKFSIYFKNNDIVYFQKGFGNKVNLYIDQINDVNIFNPNWLEGKIKEEEKAQNNVNIISRKLKEVYGKHFYIKVDCNDVYTFYNYDDEVLEVFLEKQLQLFPEEVADTPEAAEEFLEDCMAVVCKNLLYLRIELNAVLRASLRHNLPASERLDGSLEKLVCLKTYDKLVLSVDITGSVRGDG